MRGGLTALGLAAALVLPLEACGQAPKAGDQASQVWGFKEDDAGMNIAIADARRNLPTFWKWLESGDPRLTAGGVKVALDTASGELEHIWVMQVQRSGGKISGRLANEPYDLPKLNRGSPVSFSEDRISDWMLVIDGRTYGSFTTRYMLDHADLDDEAQRRAELSDTPVPKNP